MRHNFPLADRPKSMFTHAHIEHGRKPVVPAGQPLRMNVSVQKQSFTGRFWAQVFVTQKLLGLWIRWCIGKMM